MSKLRVHSFGISLDGYGAGPDQDLDNPLGRGGLMLHDLEIENPDIPGGFRLGRRCDGRRR
jgi:hypothetical protein